MQNFFNDLFSGNSQVRVGCGQTAITHCISCDDGCSLTCYQICDENCSQNNGTGICGRCDNVCGGECVGGCGNNCVAWLFFK